MKALSLESNAQFSLGTGFERSRHYIPAGGPQAARIFGHIAPEFPAKGYHTGCKNRHDAGL